MSFDLAIISVCLQIAALGFAFSARVAPMVHVENRYMTISIALWALALIVAEAVS